MSWKEKWRTERDSNPRYGCPYTRVPGVRLQPLGPLSVASVTRLSGAQYTHGAIKCKHLNKFFFRCLAAVDCRGVAGLGRAAKNGCNVPCSRQCLGRKNLSCRGSTKAVCLRLEAGRAHVWPRRISVWCFRRSRDVSQARSWHGLVSVREDNLAWGSALR